MTKEPTPDDPCTLEAMLSEAACRVGARAALLAGDDGTLLAAAGDVDPRGARRLAVATSGAVSVGDLMACDLALGVYVAADGHPDARIYVRKTVVGRLLVTIFDDAAPALVGGATSLPVRSCSRSRLVGSGGGCDKTLSPRDGALGPRSGHRTTGCSGARATVTTDCSSGLARAR